MRSPRSFFSCLIYEYWHDGKLVMCLKCALEKSNRFEKCMTSLTAFDIINCFVSKTFSWSVPGKNFLQHISWGCLERSHYQNYSRYFYLALHVTYFRFCSSAFYCPWYSKCHIINIRIRCWQITPTKLKVNVNVSAAGDSQGLVCTASNTS